MTNAVSVAAANHDVMPAYISSSNNNLRQGERLNHQRMLSTTMDDNDSEGRNSFSNNDNDDPFGDEDDPFQEEEEVAILNKEDLMQDDYMATDSSNKNQLEKVISRRNPRPRCNLCPYGQDIGDPNRYFTNPPYGGATCQDFNATQEENVDSGQGGYSENMCRSLKKNFLKHCQCHRPDDNTPVTRCVEQMKLSDPCDPSQPDDQCCIGGCRYLNRYKKNLCTTLPGDPTIPPTLMPATLVPTPPPVDRKTFPPTLRPTPRPPLCNIKITIDTPDDYLPPNYRCGERSKSFGLKYTGGGCSMSNSIQPLQCNNFETNVPILDKVVSFIRVTDAGEEGKIYFEDFVGVGDFFVLNDGSDETSLIADSVNATIYSATSIDMLNSLQAYSPSPDLMIETMIFNTDCNQDLFLCDSFGSLLLVSFTNTVDGFKSIASKVETYEIVVENTGDEDMTIDSLGWSLEKMHDEAVLDRLSFNFTEQHGNVMRSGQKLNFQQEIVIEALDGGSHAASAIIRGTSPGGSCEDVDHKTISYEGCHRK